MLESYRDTGAGRPKHRCVARWRAGRSLAEELGRTRWEIEHATRNATYWQGLLDRTVKPRSWSHIGRARDCAPFWQRRLTVATAQLTALTEARQALGAADADIDRAEAAEREAATRSVHPATAGMTPGFRAPDRSLLAGLADRVRGLMVQNDPDALRAGLGEIAAALDALSAS